MEYLFYDHKHFDRVLNQLWKKGGPYQNAVKDIEALLYRVFKDSTASKDHDPFRGLRLTKYGEGRIRNCVKYDLNGFSRLVTIQSHGYCIFLYCGTHEDCERWIESHRGLEPVVGEHHDAIITFRSTGDETNSRLAVGIGHYSGPLFERLPGDLYDRLVTGISRRICHALELLDLTMTETELWSHAAQIADAEQRLAVHDVFVQLKDDRVSEAVARVKLFLGEVTPMDSVDSAALPEIVDSDVIRRIDPRSPRYAEAMGRFIRSARYRDWMLYMNLDQERIVQEDFDGSAKLVGVSGSGKTCVIIKRAVRLAEIYGDSRILVLTLNKALAQLIDELVTECCTESVRRRIEVKAFFSLCQELMLECDPGGSKLYDEVTWKTNEHVEDDIWPEYYECENHNFDARVFHPVHDSLLARGWNPERYLRGELDWLRSALPPRERAKYLDLERKGRRVMLSHSFRELILGGTAGWEDKMRVVGVVDALGLAQSLIGFLPRIEPRYRCVLVDEVQDFGNIELQIIRALVSPAPNDLFLSGDAAQAVTTKHQRLRDIGIEIPGSRSRRLTKNYRNSRDVLAAAYAVLLENMTDDLIDREDLEPLDPEFSAFSGATPVILQGASLEEELRGALALAKTQSGRNADSKSCICACGFSLRELKNIADVVGVPVLDGKISLDDGAVFISDLAQTKGFEFDLVCIVNCRRDVLPEDAAPEEECYRALAMLYVAMTRAKTDLVLSWSESCSPFLPNGENNFFLLGSWREYVEGLASLPHVRVPQHFADFRLGENRKNWRDMTGEEFLYSSFALGVSVELSAKIRAVVDGTGLRRGDLGVKWARMGTAADAFRRDPRVRNAWGPDVGKEFADLIKQLPPHPQNLQGLV